EIDVAGCEKLLPRLRQLGPAQFETVAVEFQCRALSADWDAARRLLSDYIAAAPTPGERSVRGQQTALFLFNLVPAVPGADHSRLAAQLRGLAIDQMQAVGARDAEALQRWATLLAQNRQVAEALELVRSSRAALPLEALASTEVQVLRNGPATD